MEQRSMDPNAVESIMAVLTQFGAAGLIGMLWILERRSAAARERQLTEAHQRLMSREHEIASLLQVVRDNTAAMKSMEYTQRRLVDCLRQGPPQEQVSAA
jgi:hypothetical protein